MKRVALFVVTIAAVAVAYWYEREDPFLKRTIP